MDNVLELDSEQVQLIIDALLIGLTSYGEIERLDSQYEMHTDIGGLEIPRSFKPLHPTGSADTVGVFATALSLMNLVNAPAAKREEKNSIRLDDAPGRH